MGGSTAAPTSAAAATTVATTTTSTTTTMATTTTQSGEFAAYDDPAGDCLDQTNAPAPCVPAATDMLRVELTRASPLTVVIEIAAPGEPGLGESYQFTLGLDLDRDPSTGIVDFWPEGHGIGPDLESDLFGASGSDDYFVHAYSIEGQNGFVLLDPPPVVWTWLDDTHIEAVFDMDAVGDGSFGIAGDLFTGDIYDHFVDDGHLVFPGGEVVLVGP